MAHECPGVTDPAKCIRMKDPRKDFYNTGKLLNTSLNATGGLPNGGAFNIGASYVTNDGIEPFTSLKRLNLNANMTLQLTDRLQSTTTVMYANTDNVWQTDGWNSIERQLWYLTPNLDTRKAWNADGTPVMWGTNSPHPDWRAQHSQRQGLTGRWISSQYVKFDILSNLNISNRLGYDVYNENRVSNFDERPWLTAAGQTSGSTTQERFTRSSLNDDLILSLTGTPINQDFTISGLAGFNVLARENSALHGYGNDIVIPGLYNLNNFSDSGVSGDLTEKQRLLGAYGQATLELQRLGVPEPDGTERLELHASEGPQQLLLSLGEPGHRVHGRSGDQQQVAGLREGPGLVREGRKRRAAVSAVHDLR